jgi:hypothetical protein
VRHVSRRKRILVVGCILGFILVLLYKVNHEGCFRTTQGGVISVDTTQIGASITPPRVYYANDETRHVLITNSRPDAPGEAVLALEVALQTGGTRTLQVDPETRGGVKVTADGQRSERDGNTQTLTDGTGRSVARQEFTGVHVRWPVYYVLSFPEPRATGWAWVDRYTGTIRVSLGGAKDATMATIQRHVVNARYVPALSDIGAWTPDGEYFIVRDSGKGCSTVLVLQHATSEGESQ